MAVQVFVQVWVGAGIKADSRPIVGQVSCNKIVDTLLNILALVVWLGAMGKAT
jgi:hypothetical protein